MHEALDKISLFFVATGISIFTIFLSVTVNNLWKKSEPDHYPWDSLGMLGLFYFVMGRVTEGGFFIGMQVGLVATILIYVVDLIDYRGKNFPRKNRDWDYMDPRATSGTTFDQKKYQAKEKQTKTPPKPLFKKSFSKLANIAGRARRKPPPTGDNKGKLYQFPSKKEGN